MKKISTDDINGQMVETNSTQTRERNFYLERVVIDRCILHPKKEASNIVNSSCIVVILYGKGIITINNKMVSAKVNDVILIKDRSEYTILNTHNEDLAFMVMDYA